MSAGGGWWTNLSAWLGWSKQAAIRCPSHHSRPGSAVQIAAAAAAAPAAAGGAAAATRTLPPLGAFITDLLLDLGLNSSLGATAGEGGGGSAAQ